MVANRLHVVEIFAKDERACHFERVTNAVRFDQRVTVAVSANPGAQMDEVRQSVYVEVHSVHVAKRLCDLGIDLRKRVK